MTSKNERFITYYMDLKNKTKDREIKQKTYDLWQKEKKKHRQK